MKGLNNIMDRLWHETEPMDVKMGVFQPGDGTRYVIQITKLPGEVDFGLGRSYEGFYVFSVMNGMAKSFEVPIGDTLSYEYAMERMQCNPWTARALLLFIEETELEGITVFMSEETRAGR